MNKKYLYLILFLVLVVAAIVIIKSQSGGLKSDGQFAIRNTEQIEKIFLADKRGNEVLLSKSDDGIWMVNDTHTAQQENVGILLETMHQVAVNHPVPATQRDNVIRRMAGIGTKVEIYERKHLIKITEKIKLFPRTKISKTYYVGDITQDKMGTYMLMEDSQNPYVTKIPGFKGFISSRYSAKLLDWRDHKLFQTQTNDIKSLKIEFLPRPEGSFEIINGVKNLQLKSISKNKTEPVFDTLKVMELLFQFRDLRFERFVLETDSIDIDSVMKLEQAHQITLNRIDGSTNTLKTFYKQAPEGSVDLQGNDIDYDRDNLYAITNNQQDLVLIQYFVFGPIFKPIEYYTRQFTFKAAGDK